jgi:tetratricopeptide (TPR) repeat protein
MTDPSTPPPTTNALKPDPSEARVSVILPPEEENVALASSNELKSNANALFGKSSYEEALSMYQRALEKCPLYLDYERAVVRANMAACCLKMKDWKDAVDRATEALDTLESIDPTKKTGESSGGDEKQKAGEAEVLEVDDELEERLDALQRTGKTLEDVRKLRVKALLRRAKAREEIGKWADLQGALEGTLVSSLSPDIACKWYIH